ncbi:MAG: hypothetical protein GTO51_09960 [Candidatus Latescibacteria bacterium]|nr:hypothetical protein [Candidatus Latescibacterota bacterium]NIM66293.1 hypothetical protein [Candidatus Latescibacterota bacterium]NIO02774.1 hypothetical protein [Candidatus Latescibacterota bacterium]NIO29909.1 hypothetical protein [Candidatus Latescibacterota bacterium]NIO57523.1 hypothetical protein [Candidatus Latescibacterota bacterium]
MMRQRFRKVTALLSPLVVFCFLTVQITCAIPRPVSAETSNDLKQIEYAYYFRGKYSEAVEALRDFLKRPGLDPAEEREAREFLAASLVLSGSPGEGRDQFLKILNSTEGYEGPDTGLFKQEVIDAFEEAKTQYSSMLLKQATEIETAVVPESAVEPESDLVQDEKKSIFKKWWFYTILGGAVIVVAAASASKEDDASDENNKGTLTIGVTIH